MFPCLSYLPALAVEADVAAQDLLHHHQRRHVVAGAAPERQHSCRQKDGFQKSSPKGGMRRQSVIVVSPQTSGSVKA